MESRWQIKTPHPQKQAELSRVLDIHPLIAQLLINRSLDTPDSAREFLFADVQSIPDPFLLKDMDVAVERLKKAKEHHEQILIFGDYDVDGVTSSALLHNLLRSFGIAVLNHIPHRMSEGYGLNTGILDYAREHGVQLIISVDCGITAIEEVQVLQTAGIEVMIIDHHEPLEGALPQAQVVIDPKRKDCPYPFKYMASVGLVFKLAQALLGRIPLEMLDLVAVGTISDVVPLIGENRIFVREGLKRIQQTKNKGLLALMDVARLKDKKLETRSISFILGPRINATGRVSYASKSLKLFLSEDWPEAYECAQSLERDNQERQKMQSRILTAALEKVDSHLNLGEQKIIVVAEEGWHRGVLGIVASRILDTYRRPTVIVSFENEMGTGSARSFGEFHMQKALTHCAVHLENFGGHQHAAGLTIRKEKFDDFCSALNDYARDIMPEADVLPALFLDADIPLSSWTVDLVRRVEDLEPFGEGNPAPLFCSRNLKLKGVPAVLSKETLKFFVTDGSSLFSAVGFGMADRREALMQSSSVDLAYQISIDTWNKAPTVQLKIKDMKFR